MKKLSVKAQIISHAIILDDIRSVHNVGSFFRLADCAGIGEIHLCGYTPAPTDRFGRARQDIAKVALGAEKTVVWKSNPLTKAINDLKKRGFTVVAVEQDSHSQDYKSFGEEYIKFRSSKNKKEIKKPLAFWFGSEPTGIKKTNLKKADVIIEIPLRGDKESLNVVQAASIVIFRVLNI